VQEKGYEKPSGPEIAQLRRKRSATKRNTDQVMGRSADQENRRRYNASQQSDASQCSHTEELSQQPASAGVSQQGQGKCNKRRRVLWGKYHVSNPSHEPQAHSDDVEKTVRMRSVVPILAKQLAIDFQFNGEDDYVPIDDAFRLPQTNYETHGHFLSSCIAFCTMKKTGHSFVRASVDSHIVFARVRIIRKISERLVCSCATTTVQCRPCRHVIAFNRGVTERTDFADFHTKQYHSRPHTIAAYTGVCNFRKDDLSLLPPLPPHYFSDAAPHGCDDGDNFSNNVNVSAKNIRKVRGYHSCAEEFKRVLVKWGNVSRVLQRFEALVREFDESLGAVETHRAGRPSSKPTPQASRR
jgi:hypothetical protein